MLNANMVFFLHLLPFTSFTAVLGSVPCFQPLPFRPPPPPPTHTHRAANGQFSRGLSCASQSYHWSSSIMALPGKGKTCRHCNHRYYPLSDSALHARNKEISLSVSWLDQTEVPVLCIHCHLQPYTSMSLIYFYVFEVIKP